MYPTPFEADFGGIDPQCLILPRLVVPIVKELALKFVLNKVHNI